MIKYRKWQMSNGNVSKRQKPRQNAEKSRKLQRNINTVIKHRNKIMQEAPKWGHA